MTPPSPPSPPTPPSPLPRVRTAQEIAEEKRKAEELQRKEQRIGFATSFLGIFAKDAFINALSTVINNKEVDFEKRYLIAEAIMNILADQDLDNEQVRLQIKRTLTRESFNSNSPLYTALNQQSNWLLPITFFGDMHWISFNYARSLQAAHKNAISSNPEEQQIPKNWCTIS